MPFSRETHITSVAKKYLLRVFRAFAHQACELGRSDPNLWSVNRVDDACIEFLRQLATDVQVDLGESRIHRMIGHFGYIVPEVWEEFAASPEWEEYQQELGKIAELQATGQSDNSDPQGPATPPIHKGKITSAPAKFPERAAWTKTRLRERGWDHNDPCRFGGPDRKTMLKILAGEEVKEDTIAKLVRALNARLDVPGVKNLDVPNN